MAKKICEIDEVDVDRLRYFISHLKDGDLVKYDCGLLTTPGCQNDHGCCSKDYDLQALLDELEKAV